MYIILFISLLFVALVSGDDSWSYEGVRGPKYWPQYFKQCGGRKQSPINVKLNNVLRVKHLDCINFEDYFTTLSELEILNADGKTIEILPPANKIIRINGGELRGTYRLAQFHFHWGATDSKGSEHTFNGASAPLEMHLVHFNEKYGSAQEAVKHKNGLAVVAVFYKLCHNSSGAMEIITQNIRSVLDANSSFKFSFEQSLHKLLPISHSKNFPLYNYDYIRYFGSLTTPQCNEAVTWTLLMNVGCISRTQLKRFRHARKTGPGEKPQLLKRNYRPTQPLNGRVVIYNEKCSV